YYPRAWMVHKAINLPADQVQAKMKEGGIDYLNEVVLEQEADVSLSGAINAADKVECLEYNANDFKYKVNAESDGILCFSEVWYPAWKAYIDGKPVDILHANYTFRAVAVPQGEHIVEMRYESDTYATGKWISIITLLLSLGGLVFLKIRKKD
ncbi:MAG: YfhO family protein, partial [Chlorobi bacterium]|nr:YfhO family protein [Chlorobiota bacterium]